MRGVRNGVQQSRSLHLVLFSPVRYSLRVGGLLLVTFFVSFSSTAAGYLQLNDRLQQAQAEVLRLHFVLAAPLLEQEARSAPNNLMAEAIRCKQLFLVAFVDEKETSQELFFKRSATLSARLQKEVAEKEPLRGFVQAELLLLQVMLHAQQQATLSAAIDLRSCRSLIEKNAKTFPSFLPNAMISGAVESVLGAVPVNYQWLLKLVGWEGDVEKGMSSMITCLRRLPDSPYESYTDEVLFLVGSLHNATTPDRLPDPILMQRLQERYPTNELLKYVYTGLLMKQGKNDAALAVLMTPSDVSASIKLPLLQYRRGLALLRKLDDRAGQEFLTFLRTNSNGNCVKAAWQKMAWWSLLKNDRYGYDRYMKYCIQYGRSLIDEDKAALREAESGSVPNIILLRSRLLFDGGYYRQAMQSIVGVPADSFPTEKDKLELTYRFARILDAMERKDQAIFYYKLTLKNGQAYTTYFAANSALLLGNIYEKRGNREMAKAYYNDCLSMRNHDYQNSIDQKARAGLQRCK